MDVRLPDGTLLRNVPEGTTKAQLTEKLAANGYDIGKLAPVEATATRENVLPERAPDWAKKYPKLYEGAVTARQMLGPTIEAGGAIVGGILGGGAGTVAGPVGTATGGVAGAGLGYGIAKEALEQADVALGLKAPRTTEQLITEPAKNILEGATYEAGGRVAAPIIAKGASKVAGSVSNVLGKVADLRQIPTQKAAKIAREAVAGGELDQVLNALRNAAPGVTPAQAIADAGLNQPTVQSLLKNVATRDPKFFTDLLNTQDFATVNKLSQLAGGETATASRNTLANAKAALNAMTGPQREAALSRANLGKAVAEYEKQAGKLSGDAAAKVQEVRDLISAGNAADAYAKLQVIKQGLPTSTARYTYANELAEKAFGEWSDKAAQASLDLGQGAKFSQAAADTLRKFGIKPIQGDVLSRQVLSIADNPAFAGNDILAGAVRNVADDIAKWTSSGGVVDARALDAIRKNSVNAAIEKLRPGMDATAQKRLAAEVLSDIKPLLVDAIEGAGGTGYRKYLENYTKGMQNIGQTKLGAQAMDLYKKSPQQFVDLVEGNSPEVVEKIFGTNNYDIAVEMSKDAIKTLEGAAKQITSRAEMAKQATAGDQALVELMKDHAINLKLPNVFNVVATTTNKTLDIVGKIVTKRTMAKLTEAAKTAKSFDELLNTLPASERNAILKALKDPKTYAGLKETGKKFTGAGAVGANALARGQENENALAR
jgi:uncharacterized protein YjgD (DUF1641 family)